MSLYIIVLKKLKVKQRSHTLRRLLKVYRLFSSLNLSIFYFKISPTYVSLKIYKKS